MHLFRRSDFRGDVEANFVLWTKVNSEIKCELLSYHISTDVMVTSSAAAQRAMMRSPVKVCRSLAWSMMRQGRSSAVPVPTVMNQG